jgi:hypothetical protein
MENRRLYLRESKNGALRILPIREFAPIVLHGLRWAMQTCRAMVGDSFEVRVC